MHKLTVILQFMRLDKPTGIWLLMWPCWWGMAIATHGMPPQYYLLLFTMGALVMRAAGCIVNDIVDRRLDAQVERTRTRPLASGAISVGTALLLLAFLLAIALWIALQFHFEVLYLAIVALPMVMAYPFMKRITWWPQLFLGITFNSGALFGWVAIRGMDDVFPYIGLPALLLYVGGVCWTLGYDTIYGFQDIKDDEKIDVKSSSRRIGIARGKIWVAGFYILAVACWAGAGLLYHQFMPYYFALALALAFLLFLTWCTNLTSPRSCMRHFKWGSWVGLILYVGIVVG